MKKLRFCLPFFLLPALTGCGSDRAAAETGYLAFDGTRAFAEVETQVSFGPRVPGTENHRACAAYLAETLKGLADEVETDEWDHLSAAGDTLRMINIRAAFRPGAGTRILLCAHWDTRPIAEHDPYPEKRGLPIPGANDGASGVAVLLELARVFSLDPPAVGVDIVLFDGEDYGDFYEDEDVLVGSRRFAALNSGYRPRFGILLDMVGDASARFPWEGNSWAALPDVCRLVWDTAHGLGYGEYFPRQVGVAVIDDHIPLLKTGIRCINIIQMGLPYWHTHADTPDKLSPSTLEAVGRTVAAVVFSQSP